MSKLTFDVKVASASTGRLGGTDPATYCAKSPSNDSGFHRPENSKSFTASPP